MGRIGTILLGIVITLAALAATAWVLARWMRRSEDEPRKLVLKWIVSAIILTVLILVIGKTPPELEAAFIVPINVRHAS